MCPFEDPKAGLLKLAILNGTVRFPEAQGEVQGGVGAAGAAGAVAGAAGGAEARVGGVGRGGKADAAVADGLADRPNRSGGAGSESEGETEGEIAATATTTTTTIAAATAATAAATDDALGGTGGGAGGGTGGAASLVGVGPGAMPSVGVDAFPCIHQLIRAMLQPSLKLRPSLHAVMMIVAGYVQ